MHWSSLLDLIHRPSDTGEPATYLFESIQVLDEFNEFRFYIGVTLEISNSKIFLSPKVPSSTSTQSDRFKVSTTLTVRTTVGSHDVSNDVSNDVGNDVSNDVNDVSQNVELETKAILGRERDLLKTRQIIGRVSVLFRSI